MSDITQPVRILISTSHSAHFNLAVEEVIFRNMDPRQTVLFLWRNDNVVVIGRGQNPWKECNTRLMEEDDIMLARRHSGGGAVFQDLGNSCFTFMAGKPGYDRKISTKIVLDALNSLEIPAIDFGRNDIVIEQGDGVRKISGSAFRERPDRGFHHGTLLLDVNLDSLAKYLNPDPKKLKAKGITSVRSRVENLKNLYPNLSHEDLFEALVQAFCNHYGVEVTPEYISPDNTPNLPGFEKQYALQQAWDWNFGSVMEFSHHLSERFTWGGIDLHLNVNRGVITEAKLFTDSLVLDPLEVLENALPGKRYEPSEIEAMFPPLQIAAPEFKAPLEELKTWLVNAIK